jgi:dTDP-glucose pyrophosphorylase
MINYKKHLINEEASIHDALVSLNDLGADAILFIVDKDEKLLGSLTDGDLRRGFLKEKGFDNKLVEFLQPSPKSLKKSNYSLSDVIEYRNSGFRILPVVNEENRIVNVVNFRHFRSYLPLDAVIMAGGRGERLKPLTDNIPKPLLKVGPKPIIEHNIDRLRSYGIDDIWISIKYLGDSIKNYFNDGTEKSIRIRYIEEKEALGTAGALSLAEGLDHNALLMMNSDLLTNINYEDFYLFFLEQQADIAVACIPYQVKIPYGVMETTGNIVTKLREKPTYTHFSNAGIYIIKKEVLNLIPHNAFYNATDLMEKVIENGGKVAAYSMVGYWLDIGRHDDYEKAQEDIKHIEL